MQEAVEDTEIQQDLGDRIIRITQNPIKEPVPVKLGDAWRAVHVLLNRYDSIAALYMLEQIWAQVPEEPSVGVKLLAVRTASLNLEQGDPLAQQLLGSFPDSEAVAVEAGRFYYVDGRPERGIIVLEDFLDRKPQAVDAIVLLAEVYKAQGTTDKTIEWLKRGLEFAPRHVDLLTGIARLLRTKTDPSIVDRIEFLAYSKQFKPGEQVGLEYALAWIYADDPEKQFRYLNRANGIVAQVKPWNEVDSNAEAERNLGLLRSGDIEALAAHGDRQFRPIFIAAMPRSGTTMLEQMLGAHSGVYCVGEQAAFNMAAQATGVEGFNLNSASRFDEVNDYPGAIAQTIRNYRDCRQVSRAGGHRVVDKSIGNYSTLGLILLAFPNARIIHLRRHPMAIIYSCYQQNFATGHDYSNKLEWAAQMYKAYDRQMAEWKEVFPNRIHTLRYEDLVTEPEAELRKVLEYCGLEWEDACLNFHENVGSIRTASLDQVRLKLYTGSIEKWKRVESYMAEAVAELGDAINY